jgi:rubrerythrin
MRPELPDPMPVPARGTPIDRRFLGRLMASPEGRAFLLGFMADAEESDEAMVFDTLLARVDDPQLNKLVRIHRDDEDRHAQMLRACVARIGIAPAPVPTDLRIVLRIDRELGGFADRFQATDGGVMEAYLLLQVIEERAVMQYPLIARALRHYDPKSADTVMRVVEDEERHVRYARAISRKYAPDPETLRSTLVRFRAAEGRAFAAHGNAFLAHVVDHDLLAVGPIERRLWRWLAAATRPGHASQPTTVVVS